MEQKLNIRCVGDLILDLDHPETYFSPEVVRLLQESDMAIGQIEIPHTTRGVWSNPEASTSTSGRSTALQLHSGSASTGISPAAKSCGTCSVVAQRAVIPSTFVSPCTMA